MLGGCVNKSVFGMRGFTSTSRRMLGSLFKEIAPAHSCSEGKVSIIGAGQVGMAGAYSIMQQHMASEICMVDASADKLKGEMLDLQQASAFTEQCTVKASTDFKITEGSRICVVTAGARQKPGESRLSLVQRNVDIYKGVIPQLVKYSPNAVIMIVSNPVDVLTYVAWKLSGLPAGRVIGSGTTLDSGRLRYFLSERLQVSPNSCNGWVIGEHGDSSVPVWSGVNVAGVPLNGVAVPNVGGQGESKQWKEEIHKKVVGSAYEVIKLKGYTSWAIGLSLAKITKAVVQNSREVLAVSTNGNGSQGLDRDVFLSLPCVLGHTGVTHIVEQNLNADEAKKLQKSAEQLVKVQDSVKM